MLEDNFTELDRMFRSAMDGAEAEVPSGVWSNLCDHLDALIAGTAGVAGASAAASSTGTTASSAGASGATASAGGTAAASAETAASATGAASASAGAGAAAGAATASHVVTAVVVSTLAVGTGVGSYFVLKQPVAPLPEAAPVAEYVAPAPVEMSPDTIDLVSAIRRVRRPVSPEPQPEPAPQPSAPETPEPVVPTEAPVPEPVAEPESRERPKAPDENHRKLSADLHLMPEFAGVSTGLAPVPMLTGLSGMEERQALITEDGNSACSLPISYGIGLRFYLSRRWSVGTGLNFTKLERRFKGSYAWIGEDGHPESAIAADFVNRQAYAGVPLTVYYDLLRAPKWNVAAFGGGMLEKCLYDRYRADGVKGFYYLNRNVKSLQSSLHFGAEVEYRLTGQLGVYLAPGARYCFPGNQPNTVRRDRPVRFYTEFGLRFSL